MIRALGILVFLLSFVLSSTENLFSQNLDKEELKKRYLNSGALPDGDQIGYYETPPIFEDDSIKRLSDSAKQIKAQFVQPIDTLKSGSSEEQGWQMSDDNQSQIIPKPGPSQLGLFGENLFDSRTSDFSPAPIAAVPPDYRLGPGDNLIINLWGRVDMELNLTVDREGKLFIPRAGEMVAFDLTLEQFERKLKKKLETIYSDFHVGVMLGKIRTIRVYVYGEVKNPGGYTISSLATLLNALYFSGGPGVNGSMREIRLIRAGEVIATVDLYQFLLQGQTVGNLKLESEDVIFVPIVGPRITIRGEVKRPAIYELKSEESLLDIIELAGGVADEAYLGRVMIDRISNSENRMLLDLSLATPEEREENNIKVMAGDDISVFAIYEKRQNVVWLSGHVKHPGAYQLEQQETISKLLDSGKQLREEVYLPRADLIRTYADGSQELIPVNVGEALDGNPKHNLKLAAHDSLHIYGSREVVRQKYVSISGEIRQPGQYRLFENMKISDLIFMAGGLQRSAYTLTAEIARRSPGEEIDIIFVDLERIMENSDPESDLVLHEDDYVFIRRMPQWDLDNFVTIMGEVRFPGKYALNRSDETLYNLIQRAGGLTPDAFAFGTIFIRGEIQEKLDRMNLASILDRSNPISFDSAGSPKKSVLLEYNPAELSRMVIDLESILESEGESGNVVLQKGDQIYIPPSPSGVQITGAVASSGTMHYYPGKKAGFYIEHSGGYLPHADKRQMRVIRANGQVLSNGRARSHKIGLGDIVMVPSKIKKDKNVTQTLLTSISIISSIATTVFIIDRL
jgi:polysaccharide export outer membrane protein